MASWVSNLWPATTCTPRNTTFEASSSDLQSQFIADGDPVVSEIIATTEYFEVEAVGHELLDVFVDLSGFLRLTAPLAENDIAGNVCAEAWITLHMALYANDATLLGVL